MIEAITDLPFALLGWTLLQFLWISTLLVGGIALVLKLLDRFSSRLKYIIAMGALLLMAVIPGLLWIEHNGTLTPIGLADWGSAVEVAENPQAPLFNNLPKIGIIDLGEQTHLIYHWLGVGWLIGALLYFSYYVISAIILQFQCRKLEPVQSLKINGRLQKLAAKLDVPANFRIRKTRPLYGPAVAGIIRPFLMIPSSLPEDYEDDELNVLLLHELVHIKRKDYFFSVLQCVVGGLFFVQPLVRWLNHRINRERELACDETVTAITKDSYTYASTLVKLYQQTNPVVGHTINLVEHGTVARIRKLSQPELDTGILQKLSRYFLAGLVLVVILFSVAWNSYHLHFLG